MSQRQPLRVALLSGGHSPEREISLASGICVAAALTAAGHAVRQVDPAETDLRDVDWRMFDIAFNALHGGAGEDGRVQRTLDTLGIPYTGAGPEASRLAMSKSAAKQRLFQRGVPTPAFTTAAEFAPLHAAIGWADSVGWPVVVKPDGAGSSLGVALAADADQLQQAVAGAVPYGTTVLIESYVAGREFTVAVLDRTPFPLLEVVGQQEIFTYVQKYGASTVRYDFHFDLPGDAHARVTRAAVAAAEALGTEGLVRVDLRLDAEENPWVLEVNTSPGMTETSMVPRAARQAGLNMRSLCDYLVRARLALEISA